MPIIFHKNTKEFHLYNDEISYIFCILRNGQPGQIYYGRKIKDRESFQHLIEYSMRDMAPCTYEGDRTFSMEYLKQEYPSYGHGDMREPAYEILQEDGSRITEFTFEDYVILKGKRKLEGLPAVYTESDEEAEHWRST